MLFDTDILIWVQRGNRKAARLIDRTQDRYVSVYSRLELLQNANNKEQHQVIKNFLETFDFATLSLSENIGYRALIYIEEYSLSHGLRAGDAIIAATAAENNLTLVSGNAKHFRPIKELKLQVFKP